MTKRETKFLRAALQSLHDQDGGQVNETILHSLMTENLGEVISLGDFNSTMRIVDTRGWATVVPSEFKGKLRKINPAGEAALQEMQ